MWMENNDLEQKYETTNCSDLGRFIQVRAY
jgi:hypothetical protein